MALIYCYRWSCYSWREITKSQPNFSLSLSLCVSLSQSLIPCESDVNVEINNEESFCFHKMFRSRFDSVQWSCIAYSHTIVLHAIIFTPNKRVTSDALAGESNRSWLFPFCSAFVYTNAIIRGKYRLELVYFVLVLLFSLVVAWCCRFYFVVCCVRVFFSLSLFFVWFNEEHWLWLFVHINKFHAYDIQMPTISKSMQSSVTRREFRPRNNFIVCVCVNIDF